MAEQQDLIVHSPDQNNAETLCSPGLRKLLVEGDDSGGACRLIALNATLRAECQAVLPRLEAAKAPASRDEILAVVLEKMPAYGVTAKSQADWKVSFESYLIALEGLPLYAVHDAFDRWDRGEGVKDIAAAGFPPRPPQLALLAVQAKQEVFTAAYRAKKALDHVEKEGVEWTRERRMAERQKMIEAGYLNEDGSPNITFKARGMPVMPRPSINQHALAEQLRRTDAQARHSGAPISRHHIEASADPGDVI